MSSVEMSSISFDTGLLRAWDLAIRLAWLTNEPSDCVLSLPSQCWNYKNVPPSSQCVCLFVFGCSFILPGYWVASTDPCICKASTLLIEPSLPASSFKI